MNAVSQGQRAAADALAKATARLGTLAIKDAPLGARTTYRVGGTAALLAEVANDAALAAVAAAVAETAVEVLVVGKGSNLLVADGGFAGLVVVLGKGFETISIADTTVTAGGAVSYPVLARQTAAAGLSGMEWAVGVPGSVGGAVRMNAGGHGAATADRLVSARLVDLRSGLDRQVGPGELAFSYRHSAVGRDEVVVAARYGLQPGDRQASEAQISEIVAWRRVNQPGGRNAGSVFQNPPGDAAGRLIEAAGGKGLRLASAEVSTKHANFIQADAGGAADDVARLIETVREMVEARCGVRLELEVQLVGFAK